ncbi:MAG: hypothetical protein AAFX40_05770 [Cyanobacteria bacterium J06639_1]
MIRFARRLQPLQANVFADMDRAKADARAAGMEVIDLSLGSSDLAPPPEAIAVLHEAADDPSTYGYCLFDSTRDFRRDCAHWYETKFRIRVDPERAGPLGITPDMVAGTVNFSFNGRRMRRYVGETGEIEMIMGLPENAQPGLSPSKRCRSRRATGRRWPSAPSPPSNMRGCRRSSTAMIGRRPSG